MSCARKATSSLSYTKHWCVPCPTPLKQWKSHLCGEIFPGKLGQPGCGKQKARSVGSPQLGSEKFEISPLKKLQGPDMRSPKIIPKMFHFHFARCKKTFEGGRCLDFWMYFSTYKMHAAHVFRGRLFSCSTPINLSTNQQEVDSLDFFTFQNQLQKSL